MHVSAIMMALMTLSGCASIISGTTQEVKIDTPGAPGAKCELSSEGIGTIGITTPSELKLKRRKQDLSVNCQKMCYQTATANVKSGTAPWTWGNIIFGGLIGWGIDAGTGAWNQYDAPISVPMQTDQSCQAAALVEPRAGTNSVTTTTTYTQQTSPTMSYGTTPQTTTQSVLPLTQ